MSIQLQSPDLRAALAAFSILSQVLFISGAVAAAEALPVAAAQQTLSPVKQATPIPASKELAPSVRLCPRNQTTFVITHGMGGTVAEDRFHHLAAGIVKMFPDARVIRVDWCELASAKSYGLPNPWKVAASIDEVGDQAALLLQREKIDPRRSTFIGESFGNWVNARIAQKLGGVQGILAFNPANEAGYPPPDLRRHAQRSWSFHTYSVFDTTREIAESDFWLETPAHAGHWDQHTSGVKWLLARVDAGDQSWLLMDKPLPKRCAGHFQALATIDGLLSGDQLPRERPVPTHSPSNAANPPATDIASAAHG